MVTPTLELNVLKAWVPASRFKEPVAVLVMMVVDGPGFCEPLKMPAKLTAPFTVMVNVPWLIPEPGPALKPAALAVFQTTRLAAAV